MTAVTKFRIEQIEKQITILQQTITNLQHLMIAMNDSRNIQFAIHDLVNEIDRFTDMKYQIIKGENK
jgi:hypothetical protein